MKRNNIISGTLNSNTTQMDDNEDDEITEIIQQPVIKKTKKNKTKIKN